VAGLVATVSNRRQDNNARRFHTAAEAAKPAGDATEVDEPQPFDGRVGAEGARRVAVGAVHPEGTTEPD